MYPNYFSNDISNGEKEVFKKFSDDKSYTKDWIVLHSFNISQHNRHNHNGEADFVILIPNKGILILEVKAHKSVTYDQTGWTLGLQRDKRDPISQAKDNMFSIKKSYINGYDSTIFMDWAIVFTYVDKFSDGKGQSKQATNFHSYPIVGSEIFWSEKFFSHLESLMDKTKQEGRPHDRGITIQADFDNLIQLLRPSICGVESPKGYYERTKCEVAHLDNIQYQFLDFIHTHQRIIFDSHAGTGKTILALEAARRTLEKKEKRILFVTFNRLINKYLESQFHPNENLLVTTIKTLNSQKILKSHNQFDILIIDEAQDIIFKKEFLEKLDSVLKGGLIEGNWIWFGDFKLQNIFNIDNQINIQRLQTEYNASCFSYRKNYRNPNQIISACNAIFNTEYESVRKDNQQSIQIHYYKDKDYNKEHEIINDIIEEVKKLGFSNKDIIILSAKSTGVAQLVANNVNDKYAQNIMVFDLTMLKNIRFSSISAFKGLESPIVILTSIEKGIADEFIYIGLTRASNRVYILGNAENKTVTKIDSFLSLKPCKHKDCVIKDLINKYEDGPSQTTIKQIINLDFKKIDYMDKAFIQSYYRIHKIEIDRMFAELIQDMVFEEEMLENHINSYTTQNSGDIINTLETEGSLTVQRDYEIPERLQIEIGTIIQIFCEFSNFDFKGFVNYFNEDFSIKYRHDITIDFNFFDGDSEKYIDFELEYRLSPYPIDYFSER
ncbi:NERD domain-containing protein [Priestia sp. JSM ZJ58]|uniref:nuclease-related domain-containing DEAD/DEAH box helicase n=1 Tax=Priestia sp. JSM ZJ58 TaxID=3376189 RepID=UPI00378B8A70